MAWVCGQKTLTTGYDSLDVHPLSCRSWLCDECFKHRLTGLRNLAASGKPDAFITLTVSNATADEPDEAARRLVHAWRMTVQRGKREGVIRGIEYLAVFEATKKGRPHLHILARCNYIPQGWLSRCMDEYAKAPIVDIRAVRSQGEASRYIAKYVSKGPGRYDGCKRYWRTMGWVVDPDELPAGRAVADSWTQIDPDPIGVVVGWYERHGWRAEWVNETRARLYPLPDTPWPYLESYERGLECTGPPRVHPGVAHA